MSDAPLLAAAGLVKGFPLARTLVDTLAKEDELQTRAGATQDHANAVRSFLAKTPPLFEGR